MSTDLIAELGVSPASWTSLSFTFMLVLARTAAATVLLPGIGESAAPSMVRAGFAFCLAILLVPSLPTAGPNPPEVSIEAGVAIIAEVTTGLIFGWLARLLTQALAVAAQFLAYLLGLSSVLQPDPELGPQSTAVARLFDMAASVAFLATGLFTLPLRALAGSYALVPPGKFVLAAMIAHAGLDAVADTFRLSLQLAAPFVVAAVVWQVGLGLMSRLVPRLQIYFVSTPGQIVGGLFLLSISASVLLEGWFAGIQGRAATLLFR